MFYRLAVFPIEIPPLRQRGDDVVLLAEHFAEKFGKEFRKSASKLSQETIVALRNYHFAGNVRELQNAVERACILADSDTLTPQDLGLNNGQRTTDKEQIANFDLTGSLPEISERAAKLVETRKICETLAICEGNKLRAAEMLGISYKTLLTKLKELGLDT